uniref:Lysyl-tRNA synthetase n=1 Tax=Colletotrichum fructicola (strain Nara gc5) TaxID=1213859 RepID=L2G0B8_COLFN
MTSIQRLLLVRPIVRTPQVAIPFRSLHVGRPSGTSRLQNGAAGRTQDSVEAEGEKGFMPKGESMSEFKKMRIKALEEVTGDWSEALVKDRYPRLKHMTKKVSVPVFKKRWIKEKLEKPSEEIVTLYGRVHSIRTQGKRLLFVTIVNEFEKIQGMINFGNLNDKITLDKFGLLTRMIEKGDHISLTGKPCRTKTGALTLNAVVLPQLLAPTMEQIPQSLTDPETRAQKRHVDMIVNPEVADVLRMRSHITKRYYFHERAFLEFQTPILAENAGGAVARSFTTTATEFPSRELSLRIAPEHLFEIGPAFRNEGIDATHNPEFTMCEFYSAYTNLQELIVRTEELLTGLAHHCQELIDTQLTSLQPIDLTKFKRPYRRLEFIPALEAALGIRLPKLTGRDAYAELLAVLTLAKIEIPGGGGPLFITHHPVCMSPLAKSFLCPKTLQLVSARTELFVNGRELANMYEEENDPEAQARKLAEHRVLGTGKSVEEEEQEAARDAPLDQNYIKALEAGLPPTGGWGCGVERLVMLFSGANRISDCLSFGTLRNIVGLTSGEQNRSGSS